MGIVEKGEQQMAAADPVRGAIHRGQYPRFFEQHEDIRRKSRDTRASRLESLEGNRQIPLQMAGIDTVVVQDTVNVGIVAFEQFTE